MSKILCLILALTWLTPAAIAARCKGEASFAIPECACTVRNRLAVGWSPRLVLSAYYAPDVPASSAEVQAVADVMSGVTECDSRLYFMYGSGDIKALGLERFEPVMVVRSGGREVMFFDRWFRKPQPD